jgi:hypothetical protein
MSMHETPPGPGDNEVSSAYAVVEYSACLSNLTSTILQLTGCTPFQRVYGTCQAGASLCTVLCPVACCLSTPPLASYPSTSFLCCIVRTGEQLATPLAMASSLLDAVNTLAVLSVVPPELGHGGSIAQTPINRVY